MKQQPVNNKPVNIKPTNIASKNATTTTMTLPKASNDLIPSFKFFVVLLVIMIAIKYLIQYTYSSSRFSDVSAIARPDSSGSYNFKAYVLFYMALIWAFCLLINIVAISSQTGGCTVESTYTNYYPLILIIGILFWLIYQNVNFYNIINERAPTNYGFVDGAIGVFLLIQIMVYYKYINKQLCQNGEKKSRFVEIGPWICLGLAIFTFAFLGYNEYILRNEVTDG